MFGILGISLLGSRLGYCNVKNYYGINFNECMDLKANWITFWPNFDNIMNAMNTLYIISSLEGWPNIMYPCLDSDY